MTITLYTASTPNGVKISIALEELGVPYEVVKFDIATNIQKEPWFLKINPNGRIPAIVDHANGDFAVFESGAILLYLAEHYDPEHKILPADPKEKSVAIQWLFWQNAGLGPMQGQSNHFSRYAPEYIPYGVARYSTETKRLYSVLESALADGRSYIIGEKFSVADISTFGWVAVNQWALGADFDLEKSFPFLHAWLLRNAQRPAVLKGYNVPVDKTEFVQGGFKMPPVNEAELARTREWMKNQNVTVPK